MSCTTCVKGKLKLPVGLGPAAVYRDAVRLSSDSAEYAAIVDLERCYLCAKKHIVAAKILFQEYHTGYSNHIKNLINSLRVSEEEVRDAFLKWQRIMGELNMGEAELLGNSEIDEEHIKLANRIRDERIKLSDDTLYVPNFDDLLVAVQLLEQHLLVC